MIAVAVTTEYISLRQHILEALGSTHEALGTSSLPAPLYVVPTAPR